MTRNMAELIESLKALPNTEKVTYISGRITIVYPRYYGGRITMTIPEAKAHLARCTQTAR